MHYRVHPKLQIGLEINPAAEEIGPLLNWFLLTETERRPALFFGTSSDRIGSPEGEQSYFLTAAKHHPTWPVSGYVSLNYSEWDDGFNVPFGVEVERIRVERGLHVETMWTDDGFVVRFPETEDPPDPALMIPAADEVEAVRSAFRDALVDSCERERDRRMHHGKRQKWSRPGRHETPA